jgi:hypothetical protein
LRGLRVAATVSSRADEESSADECTDEESDDDDFRLVVHREDEDEDNFHDDVTNIGAPIGIETLADGTDLPAMHSRKDFIPVYSAPSTYISGHYLWNKGVWSPWKEGKLAGEHCCSLTHAAYCICDE